MDGQKIRDSFIFYRSYYEAIKDLPRDIRGEVYTAIMEYGLNGITTENLKPVAKSIFTLIKPILDSGIKQYSNGLKGGRPKPNTNQNKTQTKPNTNPNKTQTKPNDNPNKDSDKDSDNDSDNEMDIERDITLPPPIEKFSPLNQNDVAFADFYKKKFKTDYIWQENTSEAIQRIADNITDKLGELGGESPPVKMSDNITSFLEAVYNLGDSWLNQRFTPQLLTKQFNQLYNRIKNGSRHTENYRSRTDNPTGVSKEYLAKIARDLAGEVQ